jgi:hypothetical protein
MTDRDLYRDAWRDLDHGHIQSRAAEARPLLNIGLVVDLDLEPGDMTRYPMTLTPLFNAAHIGSRHKPAWPGVDYTTGVVVAIGGGFQTCYALNLLGRHPKEYIHYGYVAEKFFDRQKNASAVAVALFLEAVAGVESFNPHEVVTA